MAYENITLQCADCGCDFEFTEGEQEFYAEKGLTNTPKRCTECRSNRKRMSNKKTQRQMHDVICSQCKCETQVPFKPSEDKPVFCKECFNNLKVHV